MKEYDICDFGADKSGQKLSTTAIQKAIDTLAINGGGTVMIGKGIFLSGAIFLRQGVSLCINGTLLGSDDISQYPASETRFEGRTCIWPCALINVANLHDVSITGTGTVDGNGFAFYAEFWSQRDRAIKEGRPFVNRDVPRPRLIFIEHCHHVIILGLKLKNSGFWNLHLYDSEDILVSHMNTMSEHSASVRAASTDGIDIDACSHVIVEDCTFAVDDDCICIKGGKGPHADKENKPTCNILITRCTVGFGHGVVTFGSEASMVNHVLVKNIKVIGENQLIRFKFRPDTLQVFQDITFEDIKMTGGSVFAIRPWINRQDEILGEGLPSTIKNLTVRNIEATDVISPGTILSGESITITGLNIKSVHICTSSKERKLNRHDAEEAENTDPKRLITSPITDYLLQDFTIDGKKIFSI